MLIFQLKKDLPQKSGEIAIRMQKSRLFCFFIRSKPRSFSVKHIKFYSIYIEKLVFIVYHLIEGYFMHLLKQVYNNMNPIWKISILFVFIILIMFLLQIYTSPNGMVSGYICNLITEICGIILTLVFVDRLFQNYESAKSQKEETKKIIMNNKIVQIYINLYLQQLHCITTSFEQRFDKEINISTNFSLQDLQHLYTLPLLLTEPIQQPSITSFFIYEQDLKQTFTTMLYNIDFKYNQKLGTIIEKFIETSVEFTARKAIVDNANNKTITDMIIKMLKSDQIYELYNEYKKGKLQSNLIIVYFLLYDLIKKEQEILINYQAEIKQYT